MASDQEDTTFVEFEFQLTGNDGKPYTVHAEYYAGDESEGVEPHISIITILDEAGHAIQDWQNRFDTDKFQDAAIEAGETRFHAEGHVSSKDLEPEEDEEEEGEEEEKEWHGEEGEEDEGEAVLAGSAEEEEKETERAHRMGESRNLTSVQRRVLKEDIGFSPDDEDVLMKALDIQDSLQDEKRDPTPEEALTLWKSNNLRRQVHAVRRRMHQIRNSRPSKPVGLLPAPDRPRSDAENPGFTIPVLLKAAPDAPGEPQGELSGPVPPMEPLPPSPKKPPFKAILDDAIAEADGITAAANAGVAAANAATAPASTATAAAQAPATATGAQGQALDKLIKDIDAKVKPLVKNLALTAVVTRKMGEKNIDRWIPDKIRKQNPSIPYSDIWDHPEKYMR